MHDFPVTPGPLLNLALARWTVYGPAPMPYGFRAYRAATPEGAIHLHACAGRHGTVTYDLHHLGSGVPWRLVATDPDDDAITAAAFAAARSRAAVAWLGGLGEALALAGWETRSRFHGKDLTELVFTSPSGGTRVQLAAGQGADDPSGTHWQITDTRTGQSATAELTTPTEVLTAYLTAATARRP